MGLLSNPSAPPLNGPLRKPQMLAIPFYVISILWMIALANRQLNSGECFWDPIFHAVVTASIPLDLW